MRGSSSITIGEERLRTKFDPGACSAVDSINQMTAQLIDLCETLKTKDPRLAVIAMTAYEEAALWAVKAATA